MAKQRVIIVDPNGPRREEYLRHLKLSFDVHGVSDQNAALEFFSEETPLAVAVSFRQNAGHGLEVCKAFREQKGGKHCFLLVYGDGPKKEDDREAARKRFGVDAIVSRRLDGEAMEKVLRQEVTSWRKTQQAALRKKKEEEKKSTSGSSWSQFLKADVSLKNIRSVFQR